MIMQVLDVLKIIKTPVWMHNWYLVQCISHGSSKMYKISEDWEGSTVPEIWSCHVWWEQNGDLNPVEMIFWQGVRHEVWNPYPFLRIFIPKKMGFFFMTYANLDTLLMIFPPSKWLTLFFLTFKKWDPLLIIFLTKWYLCLKIFCEKITHLHGTSLGPIYLNM